MGSFALVVRFRARPGDEAALERVLGEVDARLRASDGCELHLVMRARPGELWVTEVFRDRAAHAAALAQPDLQALADELRALLAEPPLRVEAEPFRS